MKASAIIVAAGSGRRMGQGTPKQFLSLAGKPLLYHTLSAFESTEEISEIVLLVPDEWTGRCRTEIIEKFGFKKISEVLPGGAERQDSVGIGLERSDPDCGIVVVHDGARPLVSEALIRACIAAAADYGAAVAAIPVADTLKAVKPDAKIEETISREGLWQAQTPQSFRRDVITKAFEKARAEGFRGTDDAALVEKTGDSVVVVQGSPFNLKITTPDDLLLAEAFLKIKTGS